MIIKSHKKIRLIKKKKTKNYHRIEEGLVYTSSPDVECKHPVIGKRNKKK